MSEILRLLRNEPVTCIDIGDLRAREELLDCRNHFITNIAALGAAYEQCWSVILHLAGLMPREIGHFVQRFGENIERHAELQMAFIGADEICQQELADGYGLYPFH